MAFDKNYYIDKKLKIEQRLAKRKDRFINAVITEVKELLVDQNDLQVEFDEVIKALQEGAPELFAVTETPAEDKESTDDESASEEVEESEETTEEPVADTPEGE